MERKTKENVSKLVRDILGEVGAITKHPPKDWKRQVEERLTSLNIDIEKVNIYAVRSKIMKEVPCDLNSYASILIKLRELSKSAGGIDKLYECVSLLKELKI